MIRYIAFDLDGTLLNHKKEILPSSLSSIQHVLNNDVGVILVSGRHYHEMELYSKVLALGDYSNSYIISCDGQYVFDHTGLKIKTFPHLNYDDLIKICNMFECDLLVVADCNNYYINRRPQFLNDFRNFIKCKADTGNCFCFNRSHLYRINVDSFEKIIIHINDSNSIEGLVSDLKKDYSTHLIDTIQFEIENVNVSKWNALSFLLNKLSVSPEEIIYFGDDGNDEDCFINLKNTIAMGNAVPQIQTIAKYVVSDNNNNGITDGLILFGLV